MSINLTQKRSLDRARRSVRLRHLALRTRNTSAMPVSFKETPNEITSWFALALVVGLTLYLLIR